MVGRVARQIAWSSLAALRSSRRTVKKNGVAARSAVQHAVAADGCRRKANLNELARLEAPRPELLDGLEPLKRVERLRELLVPAPRGSPPHAAQSTPSVAISRLAGWEEGWTTAEYSAALPTASARGQARRGHRVLDAS